MSITTHLAREMHDDLVDLRPAELVVYDDVDTSLTLPELEDVYGVLATLGSLGHRFAVSALASSPVPRGTVG